MLCIFSCSPGTHQSTARIECCGGGGLREVKVLPRLSARRVHAVRNGMLIGVRLEVCDDSLDPACGLVGPMPPAQQFILRESRGESETPSLGLQVEPHQTERPTYPPSSSSAKSCERALLARRRATERGAVLAA